NKPLIFGAQFSPDLQIHEKEEEEMNEKNENANCMNEEPLITADQVIEEIVEMMENSPDPGETEEEDEEESSLCSSRTNPSLLEEIRQLSQASNNNCSYEGRVENDPGSCFF
ncbi:hypothetical protein ILYODFUR_036527, partial [Ilyodon furcidens]